MNLSAYWSDLVSVALLGTDRRQPPEPPSGPLAEIALERPPSDPAGLLVLQVATLTTLRRAALTPRAAPMMLAPPAADDRPPVPPMAADLLRRVLTEWPVLEGEWLELASVGGWRLSGDLVPLLLVRHRSHPGRRSRVEALAGPVAPWLVDHLPALAPTARPGAGPADPVALPTELLAVVDGAADQVVSVVADGLRRQRYTHPSRAVLVYLMARVRPTELVEIRSRLEQLDPHMTGIGLAYHLADLAATRHAMRLSLEPRRSAGSDTSVEIC